MNGKILTSLMLIGLISLVIGSTYSFFQDIETSEGNTFTAGSLNLQVGDEDPSTVKFTLQDIKPGDSGNAANWNIKNTGSIAGSLTITVCRIADYENERIEPEEEAGDTSTGIIQGELSYYIKVSMWLDMNKDGKWSDGDVAFVIDKSSTWGKKVVREDGEPATVPTEYFRWYAGRTWKNIIKMEPGSDFNFMIDYNFPSSPTDDRTQTDKSLVAFVFNLVQ